jgi:hypothetical protein
MEQEEIIFGIFKMSIDCETGIGYPDFASLRSLISGASSPEPNEP